MPLCCVATQPPCPRCSSNFSTMSRIAYCREMGEDEPMPVVVCFGDSNTWGYDPETRSRFPPEVRWTGVLSAVLGSDFVVIEEGLNGRTTNIDDPLDDDRNGKRHLPSRLETHAPFDLIAIMLGTNDLRARLNRSATDIAQSAALLGQMAARSVSGIGGTPPIVLLIAPPPVIVLPGWDELLEGAEEKSAGFANRYAWFADRYGIEFMDAGAVITSSPIDGIHFDKENHRLLGEAVAGRVRDLLQSAR